MNSDALDVFHTPQLAFLHRGKVRDSFRIDDERRMIVATDRISAFDLKLKTLIANKGQVLSGLSQFWFQVTKTIVPNHFLERVSEQTMIVRETQPLPIEVIVRGYLSGSAYRAYASGRRTISGVPLPEGLKENQKLPTPIVTPTTKSDADEEISKEEIVARGLVKKSTYNKIEETALKLFDFGSALLESKGILLADTKYEFGLVKRGQTAGDAQKEEEENLLLIDEVHTPDSSRFWEKMEWQNDPKNAPSLDKEFLRKWMLKEKERLGVFPTEIDVAVAEETSTRYVSIYERITGEKLVSHARPKERLFQTLVSKGLVKPGFIVFCMGSPADLHHVEEMEKIVSRYGIKTIKHVCSAHKNGERVFELAQHYNMAVEPGAVVAVAGESNGLGGALAANLVLPVINCPPFKDRSDLALNLASSMMMPSLTPASTVIKPNNAALAALRALNLSGLKKQFALDIQVMKEELLQKDRELS